jgi:hypothetical protein
MTRLQASAFVLIKTLVIAHTFFLPNTVYAAVCDSFASEVEVPKLPDGWKLDTRSVKQAECEALTDKSKNDGKPLTIQNLETVRDQLLAAHRPDTLWGNLRRFTINRKVDCMIATADIKNCFCIDEKLPMALNYQQYLNLLYSSTAASPESIGVDEKNFRKLIGAAWAVREQCIAERSTP